MSKRDLSQPGVYAIVNRVNGKTYVGGSTNVYKRWASHRMHLRRGTHDSAVLQRAWNKYGPDAFDWQVLECCLVEMLAIREQHWIDLLRTLTRTGGYNIRPIASSNRGHRHSEATKALLRQRAAGRVQSAESNEKRSATQRGRKVAAEILARRGTRRGIPHTETQRRDMAERRSRVPMETIQRVRELLAAGGLTQRQIAVEVGLTQPYISKVNRGRFVRVRGSAHSDGKAPPPPPGPGRRPAA